MPDVAISPATLDPISIAGAQIGGVALEGEAEIRPLLQTEGLHAIHLVTRAGYHHPPHSHADNESVGVVLTGRMWMSIGGREVELGPGDVWFHPRTVVHETRALEDSTAIEFHSPLRADYTRYFAA
jgi:quercetin dioxygenase-like cupin family protein